ncbi:hypothetical protein Q0590_34950 [Rhodocytophaga aerolata]|uniref:Uncharacterized protein n=1 Tax=Rhodocytophaga aerolata TaxID=455078 RepID=A0ABT8RJE1_9BACT|nr:hypothetical protein [Rhodocytophaga aerolata]MDO1451524.1 hypothetical protein [Rhodocytophaga aerolata]
MIDPLSTDLALQNLSEERILNGEQRLLIRLNQFSQIIQQKSEQELDAIRLHVLLTYKDHCTQADVVGLCLHMIQVIDQQLETLKAR